MIWKCVSKAAAATAAMIAIPGAASATMYCYSPGAHVYDGSSVTVHWTVISSTAPQIAGKPPAPKACVISWKGLGGHTVITIAQGPKAGRAETKAYSVAYESQRPGHDRFVTQMSWYSRTNQVEKATVTYEIEVVGAPF